jgi:hypothetical protein
MERCRVKTDLYTKGVLTVIAGCLLWLCAMSAASPVWAQRQGLELPAPSPQPVVIVGWGTVDERGRATIEMQDSRAGRRSNPNIPMTLVGVTAPPIDVKLHYTEQYPLPVGLTRIKPAAEWEPIRSATEPDPGRPRPGIR